MPRPFGTFGIEQQRIILNLTFCLQRGTQKVFGQGNEKGMHVRHSETSHECLE